MLQRPFLMPGTTQFGSFKQMFPFATNFKLFISLILIILRVKSCVIVAWESLSDTALFDISSSNSGSCRTSDGWSHCHLLVNHHSLIKDKSGKVLGWSNDLLYCRNESWSETLCLKQFKAWVTPGPHTIYRYFDTIWLNSIKWESQG